MEAESNLSTNRGEMVFFLSLTPELTVQFYLLKVLTVANSY